MNETPKINLSVCYSKAWKSFAKWWIPLCLLAAFLLVFEWIPRLSSKTESQQLIQTVSEIVAAAENDQLEQLDEQLMELNEKLSAYARKLSTFGLYAAPFVALLSVLIIGTALMAVRDQRRRISPQQVVVVAITQLVLAFVKVLLLFLILPLGAFIYIKLYFTILLMLEENQSPAEAIKTSWKMTQGNFGSLLGLVAINSTIQFFLGLTIIGFIPATSFAQTTRATAFAMLKDADQ
jgi:hypothetical protein